MHDTAAATAQRTTFRFLAEILDHFNHATPIRIARVRHFCTDFLVAVLS